MNYITEKLYVVQDMEKWAKAQNNKKTAVNQDQKSTLTTGRKESATADAGFAILQKSVGANKHCLTTI